MRVRGPYWGWGEGEIGEGRTNYEDIVSNDLVHPREGKKGIIKRDKMSFFYDINVKSRPKCLVVRCNAVKNDH